MIHNSTVQIVANDGTVVIRGTGDAIDLRWELDPDEARLLAEDLENQARRAEERAASLNPDE